MSSAVVGSVFILLGEIAISVVLIYLFFRVKWFIPVQGAGANNLYQTSLSRKLIPMALAGGSLLAKVVGLGVDKWDETFISHVLANGVVVDRKKAYIGLLTFREDGEETVSQQTLCRGDTIQDVDGSACTFAQVGAVLVLLLAVVSLCFSLFLIGHAVWFYFRPEQMKERVFRVWRVAAVGWVITVAAANMWGGVAHLCFSSLLGSGVSWSYNAFNAAFFLDWFTYLFYFFAVKSTPSVGADPAAAGGGLNAGGAASDGAELQASQQRVVELERELENAEMRRDPNSRMLHPSIPQAQPVFAQPVYAVPVAASPPFASIAPVQGPPQDQWPYVQSQMQPQQQQAAPSSFYSSYQPRSS